MDHTRRIKLSEDYLCVLCYIVLYYAHSYFVLYCYNPLMIMTQKLMSLTFGLHDGVYKKADKLSKDRLIALCYIVTCTYL